MPNPSNQQTGANGAQQPAPQRPYAEHEVSLQDVRRQLSTIQGSMAAVVREMREDRV